MSDMTNGAGMAPTAGTPLAPRPAWEPTTERDHGFAEAKAEFLKMLHGWRGIEPDDEIDNDLWRWAMHTITSEYIPRVEQMKPRARPLPR